MMEPGTFKTPKEHITHLYETRRANPLWLEEARRSGNLVQAATRGVLYFNELLQNTDDAQGTEMFCALTDREFVARHTGKHFKHGNVERICSVASDSFNEKSTNALATGFKGIGFRAWVSVTKIIYIFSQGYTFRFDQTAWTDSSFPWHRVPIWTELKDVPKRLLPYLDKFDTLVTFIFVLNDAPTIGKQLRAFCDNPRPALFLRNIQSIHFDREGEQGTLRLVNIAKDNDPKRRLLTYGTSTQEWFVDYVEISVPDKVRDHILHLNPTECPSHLKEKKPIKMRFGFLVQKECLSEAAKAELFNNLPTKVRLNLPFAVDCHFLLKPEREQLMDNPWNHYLVECIAAWQFYFLSLLAPTQWKYVLSGLGPEQLKDQDPEIATAYAKGFNKGCEKHAFIKPLDPKGKFLTLAECCIDTTSFYSELGEALPPECIPSNLAHPGLSNYEKLSSYSRVTKWDLNHILKHLNTIYSLPCPPELHYQLLAFFMARFGGYFNDIKSHLIVLTENNGQKPLTAVSLPAKQKVATPPAFIEIPILHSKILALDTSGALRKWLEANGVETLTAKRLIEKYIVPFVQKPTFKKAHSLPLVHYLFQLFQQGEINHDDLKALNNMPVLGMDGELHPIRTLYLNSTYIPQSALDNILPDQKQVFVHPSYMLDTAHAPQWREFFTTLGAKEDLGLQIYKEVTVGKLKAEEPLYFLEYISYLFKNTREHGDDNSIFKKRSDDHTYKNFIIFPLLEYLSKSYLPSFVRHFWTVLNRNGKRFIDTDRSCQFTGVQRGEKPLLREKDKMSYLKYVLNEREVVRGTDGKFYPVSKLLTPSFRSNLIREPVADIDVEIDDELAEYLGFITRIPYQKCFEILKQLQQCPENQFDFQLYTTILKQLIQNYTNATPEQKQKIIGLPWVFLAENNSWQPINKLRCYAVEGIAPRYDSNGWLKNVLPIEEMVQLARIFSRPIKTEIIDAAAIVGLRTTQDLYQRLRDRLPLIAKIDAHHYHRSSEDVLKRLIEQYKTLKIFECDKIPLEIEDEEIEIGVPFVCIADCFYYVGKWQSHEKELLKHIARHFGLKDKSKSDFKEILMAESAEGWLANKKMKQDDLPKLRRTLDQLLPNPLPAALPQPMLGVSPATPAAAPSTPSSTSGSFRSEDPGTPGIESPLTQGLMGLNLEDSDSDTPPTTPPGEKKPAAPPPKTPEDNKTKKPPMTPAGELDLNKILITTPEGKKAPPSTPSKGKTPPDSGGGTGKVPKRTYTFNPRDAEDTEDLKKLGRRGEELIFLKLAQHFKERHTAKEVKSPPGTITLKGIHRKSGKPIEIVIKWLNHTSETYQPYDLDLIKTLEGKPPRTRFVEVKTTKANHVHFYLSKNEHELMEQNSKNYRLYCVLKGDTDNPSIKKISNLKDELENGAYELQPIKYEVK